MRIGTNGDRGGDRHGGRDGARDGHLRSGLWIAIQRGELCSVYVAM